MNVLAVWWSMAWWHGYCKHAGSVAVYGVGGMLSECSGSGWRWSKYNNIQVLL